jgi:hypothetical protein
MNKTTTQELQMNTTTNLSAARYVPFREEW